jgi:arylsulfatase A-like enzyme
MNRWGRRAGVGIAAGLLMGQAFAADVTGPRPNIVFILADDLGYTDVACFGSRYYETPHIDRLAAQGMRFTNGYTCGPNCAPTRAALMSGQYGPRTGVYTVGGIDRFNWQSRPLRPVPNVTDLPRDKITIAQTLKKSGYATGIIGKWHLGEGAGHHPLDRGFDEFFGFLGGAHDYYNDKGILRGRQPVNEPAYLTDAFGREAVSFIQRHKSGPFFLYLAFNAVHTPLESRPEWKSHFDSKPAAGGHHNAVYAGMVASLDENIGRVLALLDELKLADNTFVIFSSDNGGVGGYQREHIQAKDITDNAPLKGGKGMLYEGGIRVPYIFRWPGKIAPGSTCAEPIISVDLYPTLLELAGAPAPSQYPLDGTSYLSLLRNGGQAVPARPPLYWHFPGYLGAGGNTWRTTPAGAIRAGDWKLQEFFETGRLELFNLKDDLGEKRNLAEAQPEKAKELHAALLAWRKAVNAPMPSRNSGAHRGKDKGKGKEHQKENGDGE